MSQELIFRSDEQHALMTMLDRIAANDAEVIILGPSGVGKELYAEYIHRRSGRRDQAFVAVNCANLSPDTLENELFGHAKGAFTGAVASTHGIVSAAEGGTLFLDEIDSLGLACQSKLLRFVQLKEYRRLGEVFTRKVDVRLIASCNRDLRQLVAAGRFREDLFFRLHVLPVSISPLRDRPDDVRVLLDYFCERYAGEYRLPRVRFGAEAQAALERYAWPGNVRELENAVRYLTCLDLGRAVEPSDLPFDTPARRLPAPPLPEAALMLPAGEAPPVVPLRPQVPPPAAEEPALIVDPATPEPSATPPPPLVLNGASAVTELPLREAKSLFIETFERAYVEDALDRTSGNVTRAAEASGKHRRAFFELMRRYGIDSKFYRKKD